MISQKSSLRLKTESKKGVRDINNLMQKFVESECRRDHMYLTPDAFKKAVESRLLQLLS
jgi:hypothetical protein